MVLAELSPAAAAEPASPCSGAWQNSAAQEPFDFLARLLSSEGPCESPEPLAWDSDKPLQSPKLDAGQTGLQLLLAENRPRHCLPVDTGLQSGSSSILRVRPASQYGASSATGTGALHPFSQLQPRRHSDGFHEQRASQAAHKPLSLLHVDLQNTYASPFELQQKAALQPLRPCRTPATSTQDALPTQGNIPAQVLEQLAVGQALLTRGMHQLPGSASIPVPCVPASHVSTSHHHARSSFPMPSSSPDPCAAPSSPALNISCNWGQETEAASPVQSRKRLRLESPPQAREPAPPALASPGQPLLSHQQRDIAAHLTAVDASARGSLESTTSRIDALQGLARARGLPACEIADLKRRNLQGVKLRGEWRSHYALAGRSLLDIGAAFAEGNMDFSVPLILNGRQQDIKLGFIVQQDIAALYMQAVGGLKRYAAQACTPSSHGSELFSKGVCQSLALSICVSETPRQLMRLFTEYVCKSPNDPRSPTDVATFSAFLEQQLNQEWKQSITAAQRLEVQTALRIHQASVSELTAMRAEALEQMSHDLEAELLGALDPERIKQLSDKAHSLSVILGLAQETRLQLARKVIYEILSPWQWGHIAACFYPIMPDIVLCAKYIAGDVPLVPLPALSSVQCYAYSALTVREQAAASEGVPVTSEGAPATTEGSSIYDRLYRAL